MVGEKDEMDIFDNLSDSQIEAVKTIDEDLEIIACAGAGKTGVVTRRVVNILASKENVLPENIVAFTFTKKAHQVIRSSSSLLPRRVENPSKPLSAL